jgi:hypothetical protein
MAATTTRKGAEPEPNICISRADPERGMANPYHNDESLSLSLPLSENDDDNDFFLKFVRKVDDVFGIGQLKQNSHEAWKREDRRRKNYKGIDGVTEITSTTFRGETGIELSDIPNKAAAAAAAGRVNQTE